MPLLDGGWRTGVRELRFSDCRSFHAASEHNSDAFRIHVLSKLPKETYTCV